MNQWPEDPNEQKEPMTGERLAMVIIMVLAFLSIVFLSQ